MALRPKRPTAKHPHPRTRRKRGITFTLLWGFVREGWRVLRAVMRAVLASPPIVRAVVIPTLLLLLWLGVNWAYQTFHKPTEIFFPLDHSLNKQPGRDMEAIRIAFPRACDCGHHTGVSRRAGAGRGRGESCGTDLLAMATDVESLGAGIQPASSAVGMYQITDGTFSEATRYCIHDHVVVEDGPWHDLQSCWFNSLYTRILPSHAIELTAALLDRQVTQTIGPQRIGKVTLQRKQDLAAVIHLCGAGAGRAYAARGLRLTRNQRCGDHDVSDYLARINELKFEFAKPAAGDKTIRQGR